MPEVYKDWVPEGQKAPASQSGQYSDWTPPEGWIAEEARVGATVEATVATAAVVPPSDFSPQAVMVERKYHCRDCKEPFESLGLLMKHRKDIHGGPL